MPRRLSLVALLVATALVAGCGRKGALEPPPDQELLVKQGAKVENDVIKPKRSFLLDPLLN